MRRQRKVGRGPEPRQATLASTEPAFGGTRSSSEHADVVDLTAAHESMGGVANEEVLHEGVTSPADVGNRLLRCRDMRTPSAETANNGGRRAGVQWRVTPWGLRSEFHQ